jgi:hypothetical protein
MLYDAHRSRCALVGVGLPEHAEIDPQYGSSAVKTKPKRQAKSGRLAEQPDYMLECAPVIRVGDVGAVAHRDVWHPGGFRPATVLVAARLAIGEGVPAPVGFPLRAMLGVPLSQADLVTNELLKLAPVGDCDDIVDNWTTIRQLVDGFEVIQFPDLLHHSYLSRYGRSKARELYIRSKKKLATIAAKTYVEQLGFGRRVWLA